MILEARCLKSGRLSRTEYGIGFWWPSRRSLKESASIYKGTAGGSYIRTCTVSLVKAAEVAKEKASMADVGYRMPWRGFMSNS